MATALDCSKNKHETVARGRGTGRKHAVAARDTRKWQHPETPARNGKGQLPET